MIIVVVVYVLNIYSICIKYLGFLSKNMYLPIYIHICAYVCSTYILYVHTCSIFHTYIH